MVEICKEFIIYKGIKSWLVESARERDHSE